MRSLVILLPFLFSVMTASNCDKKVPQVNPFHVVTGHYFNVLKFPI
jgi:hypothetical protein